MSALMNDFSAIFKVVAFCSKAKMSYANLSNTVWLQCPRPSLLNCIYANSTKLDSSFRTPWHSVSNKACIFPTTPFLIHRECSGAKKSNDEEERKRIYFRFHEILITKCASPPVPEKKKKIFFGFIPSRDCILAWLRKCGKKLSFRFVTLLQQPAWCC